MAKRSRKTRDDEGKGRKGNAQNRDFGHSSPTIPHITDERELKRQKRKLSNRESAIKSRLRKQAEFDKLQAQVETLSSENRSLRDKLQRLPEEYVKLTSESNTLKAEFDKLQAQVETLSSENLSLRDKLQRHPEEYVKLTSESNSLKVCQNIDNLQRAPKECEKLAFKNNSLQVIYPRQHSLTVSKRCDCLRMAKMVNGNENLNDSKAESADGSIPTTKIVPITEFYTSQLRSQGQSLKESNLSPFLEQLDSPTENFLLTVASPTACTVNTSNGMTVWEAEDSLEESMHLESTDVEDSLEESRHLERSLSLNLSEMADLLDDGSSSESEVDFPGLYHPLVTVEGYRVNAEMAPTLRLVLSKHGDIATNSSLQTVQCRSSFFECICGIIQELQALVFTEVTLGELKSMRAVVMDLEHVRLDVGWLGKRLDDIIEAKKLVKQSSSLKEAMNKNKQGIEEIEKENEAIAEKLRVNHEKLAAIKAEATPINGTISEAKEKVKRFYKRSLVEGLL